jgi:hypothetical protein
MIALKRLIWAFRPSLSFAYRRRLRFIEHSKDRRLRVRDRVDCYIIEWKLPKNCFVAHCSLPIIDRFAVEQITSETIWKSPAFETRNEALAYLTIEVADAKKRLKNICFKIDTS